MSQTYTLTFLNDSNSTANFVCYQLPSHQDAHVKPIAWFAAPAKPQDQVSFTWTLDYSFVWGAGPAIPGLDFTAGQTLDVTSADNAVDFAWGGTAYEFKDLNDNGEPGCLSVSASSAIMAEQMAVGVNTKITSAPANAAGPAAMIADAVPGRTVAFPTAPLYWVANIFCPPGQVLDLEGVPPTPINFFSGSPAMTARLTPQEEWDIYPTP